MLPVQPLILGTGGAATLVVLTVIAILSPDKRRAFLIETPGGVQILVDGGPEGSALLSELGRQLPFWDRTLDLVVLTHPDEDHLTGLVAALERYKARAVIFREQYL